MKTYHFEILTPQGRPFSENVVHAMIPVEDGFVGVLANHTPYLTSSPGGKLEVKLDSDEMKPFEVGPGFFQFIENEAYFLTQFVKLTSL